ncbi:hypothetical protein QJS04_geneDACA020313 [Acorus gramineus]|uniref:Uncharacterized protein n=1 Tax=Acorus gramineus TaxID=55184 RepID=A0AAV9A7R5_ACOGR|nr:hypothetical protein QJS04_geneDACA020313 [Acorus gramineus]
MLKRAIKMAEVEEFKLRVAYPVALFSASCLVYPPEETLSSTTETDEIEAQHVGPLRNGQE